MCQRHHLVMLYICTKFCQSISEAFRVTDPDSRVDPRVVANDDVRTEIAPCLRQVQQKSSSSYLQYPLLSGDRALGKIGPLSREATLPFSYLPTLSVKGHLLEKKLAPQGNSIS